MSGSPWYPHIEPGLSGRNTSGRFGRIKRQMFRYIAYKQIRKQLGMVEVEPFDVGGRFDHVGSVVDQAASKLDIENNLPFADLTY